MSSGTIVSSVIGLLATLGGAWFVLKGTKLTSAVAKEAANGQSRVDAQANALEAWAGLLKPYRDEVDRLRLELASERDERQAKERRDEEDRAEAKRLVAVQLAALQEQVDKLSNEVKVWKRVAQTIARWATALRDEVLRLGGTVPATPDELLTLHTVLEARGESDRES